MDPLAGPLQDLSKKKKQKKHLDCFSTNPAQIIDKSMVEFRSGSAPLSRGDAANDAAGLKEMCFSELFPAADNVASSQAGVNEG